MSATRYRLTVIKANAATQPPRLFSAMSTGGGVTVFPESAKELERRGFSVEDIQLTPPEAAYLTHAGTKVDAGQTAYLVRCLGQVLTVKGTRFCGPPSGLKLEEVTKGAAARAKLNGPSYAPVLAFVQPRQVKSVRIFSESGPTTTDMRNRAKDFLTIYRDIQNFWTQASSFVETTQSELPGWRPSVAAQNLLAQQQRFLAMYAIPVAICSRANMGASGHRYGGPAQVAVVVFVVATLAAAIACLSWGLKNALGLRAFTREHSISFCKDALKVLKDPKAPREAAKTAQELLKVCEDAVKPTNLNPLIWGSGALLALWGLSKVLPPPKG